MLSQCAVQGAAEAGGCVGEGDGPALVGLVEEGEGFVADAEGGDAGPDGEDGAGAVGAGDYWGGCWEGVFALRREG